jgi:lysophospholipase L1-like esterase
MRLFTSLLFLFVVSANGIVAQEEGFEFVNPPMTIVVLGSSTAAGAGTWPIDNAWVNRFRCHVQAFNPENRVINLAKGGYNTFHLLPTGSYTRNHSKTDTLRNITKAMEYNPVGLIINLPSNDISAGYSVKEQLDNFRKYQAYADSFGVELWVTTTQPRNFPKERYRDLQAAVRDSLRQLFPGRCIDFWTGFADAENMVVKEFDSGDGTHLNNKGHKILTDRVIESQAFCWELNESSFQRSISIANQEELSPHMMEIGFKGRIYDDSTLGDKSRFVKIIQEDRVLNATKVTTNKKYDLQTIVDLRKPFEVVFEAPNTLTKSVEFTMDALIEDPDKPSNYYPIESIDINEISLNNFTYQFPNARLTVAKFYYDSTRSIVKLNQAYVTEQKQRLDDAMIMPPAKGRKIKTYWENGNKKSVLKFKNGQLHCKSKWFNVDGQKKRIVSFKNGMYHGKYLEFEENRKKRVRLFKNDRLVKSTEREQTKT